MIEACSPDPYLELFARCSRVGRGWGAEADPAVVPRSRRFQPTERRARAPMVAVAGPGSGRRQSSLVTRRRGGARSRTGTALREPGYTGDGGVVQRQLVTRIEGAAGDET